MNADLYKKVSKLGTKAELKVKQKKTIKLKAFGSAIFEVKIILKVMLLKIT